MPAIIRTLFEEEPSENFVQSMRVAGDYESELQIGINKKNLLDLKDKGMIVAEVNKAEFAEKTKDARRKFDPIFGKSFYEKVIEASK